MCGYSILCSQNSNEQFNIKLQFIRPLQKLCFCLGRRRETSDRKEETGRGGKTTTSR